jgi:hypothetical protein
MQGPGARAGARAEQAAPGVADHPDAPGPGHTRQGCSRGPGGGPERRVTTGPDRPRPRPSQAGPGAGWGSGCGSGPGVGGCGTGSGGIGPGPGPGPGSGPGVGPGGPGLGTGDGGTGGWVMPDLQGSEFVRFPLSRRPGSPARGDHTCPYRDGRLPRWGMPSRGRMARVAGTVSRVAARACRCVSGAAAGPMRGRRRGHGHGAHGARESGGPWRGGRQGAESPARGGIEGRPGEGPPRTGRCGCVPHRMAAEDGRTQVRRTWWDGKADGIGPGVGGHRRARVITVRTAATDGSRGGRPPTPAGRQVGRSAGRQVGRSAGRQVGRSARKGGTPGSGKPAQPAPGREWSSCLLRRCGRSRTAAATEDGRPDRPGVATEVPQDERGRLRAIEPRAADRRPGPGSAPPTQPPAAGAPAMAAIAARKPVGGLVSTGSGVVVRVVAPAIEAWASTITSAAPVAPAASAPVATASR